VPATIIGCIQEQLHDLSGRGGKIRLILGITKENINYCKELIKIVDELRHLDEIEGSIAVSISLTSKESLVYSCSNYFFYRVELPARLIVLFPAIPPLADDPSCA
jgi:hypothetical protein